MQLQDHAACVSPRAEARALVSKDTDVVMSELPELLDTYP